MSGHTGIHPKRPSTKARCALPCSKLCRSRLFWRHLKLSYAILFPPLAAMHLIACITCNMPDHITMATPSSAPFIVVAGFMWNGCQAGRMQLLVYCGRWVSIPGNTCEGLTAWAYFIGGSQPIILNLVLSTNFKAERKKKKKAFKNVPANAARVAKLKIVLSHYRFHKWILSVVHCKDYGHQIPITLLNLEVNPLIACVFFGCPCG